MNFLIVFYLLLPAFVANMMPQVATRLGILEKLYYPVDFHKTIFGKRILGDNKTWRGFIFGVTAAILVALIQYWLNKKNLVMVNELEHAWQFVVFGFLAGFGALVGDAVESFFKRQLSIGSGRPLIPFDQIDYLVGFLFFTNLIIPWSWPEIIFILICGIVLNPTVNLVAYFLKIKKTYW